MKFLEHDQIHSKSIKLFTDGSKTSSGVGCAVVHSDTSYVGRLSDNASIFTAELTALAKSLEIVGTLQGTSFTIYSDSNSALMAIQQYNSSHPIVQRIQEWLYRLASKFKYVNFCWVPAHVGIPGNERADEEAKEIISRESIDFHYIPHTDMKMVISSYIRDKWQERWMSPTLANNLKYKKIRESVKHWPSCYQSNRKAEVTLTRLRVGHTRLTHNYLLGGEAAPVCVQCNVSLTVEYFLVDCHQYSAARQIRGLAGKGIADILGPSVDTPNLMGYLQDIMFYNKV